MMKNTEDQDMSKKDQILEAALNLIKSEGFEKVTMRKIASEAHVNVGLVNYYFGTKNKLINEVIQILVHSIRDSFTILDDHSMPPKERLKSFLTEYVKAYHQYPFIARQMLEPHAVMFDSQKEFVHFVKSIGLKKMQQTIEELSGESDPENLSIMTSHLLGAIFLPVLIEPLYEKVTGFQFPEENKRIALLLDRYFPDTEK